MSKIFIFSYNVFYLWRSDYVINAQSVFLNCVWFFFVIILKMEPKKDFSTAILDAKKAPNKLIVTFLSYL